MKAHIPMLAAAVFALAFLGLGGPAQAAPAKPAKMPSAASATNAPAGPVEMEIPQSVFAIPASPKEGRNPFFPRSASAQQIAKAAKPGLADAASVILNGIVPVGPRSTAMINGRTFEKGEEAEIKLAKGGKVLVKCEEIREDSVVVLVNGVTRRELRLRSGL